MRNRIRNGLPRASNLVVNMKSEDGGKKSVALLLVCSADLREAFDSVVCQIYYCLLRVQYTIHKIQRLQILSFVSLRFVRAVFRFYWSPKFLVF